MPCWASWSLWIVMLTPSMWFEVYRPFRTWDQNNRTLYIFCWIFFTIVPNIEITSCYLVIRRNFTFDTVRYNKNKRIWTNNKRVLIISFYRFERWWEFEREVWGLLMLTCIWHVSILDKLGDTFNVVPIERIDGKPYCTRIKCTNFINC